VTLHIVTGTMGAGKSTVAELLPPLVRELVVFDIDWVIESFGMIARRPIPQNPQSWPGVRDAWLAIAAAIERGGRSTVLLGPFTPEDLQGLPSLSAHRDIRWTLLDCEDEALVERLAARGWERNDIIDALTDSAQLRTLGFDSIRTDDAKPAEVARRVAEHLRRVE
jgi:hypothetical protein